VVWGRAEEDEDGGVEKVRGAEEVVERGGQTSFNFDIAFPVLISVCDHLIQIDFSFPIFIFLPANPEKD